MEGIGRIGDSAMFNAMTSRTEPNYIEWEIVTSVMMAVRFALFQAFRAVIGPYKCSTDDCMIDGIPSSEFFREFFPSSFLTLRNPLGIFLVPLYPISFFGFFSMWLSSHLSFSWIRFSFVSSYLGSISAPPFSLVFGSGM
jgi:hypothetical protein